MSWKTDYDSCSGFQELLSTYTEMLISCYLGLNLRWAAPGCAEELWRGGDCLTYLELQLSIFPPREGWCSLQQGKRSSYYLTVNSSTSRRWLRSRVSCSMLCSKRRPLRPCEPGRAKSKEWEEIQRHREGERWPKISQRVVDRCRCTLNTNRSCFPAPLYLWIIDQLSKKMCLNNCQLTLIFSTQPVKWTPAVWAEYCIPHCADFLYQ